MYSLLSSVENTCQRCERRHTRWLRSSSIAVRSHHGSYQNLPRRPRPMDDVDDRVRDSVANIYGNARRVTHEGQRAIGVVIIRITSIINPYLYSESVQHQVSGVSIITCATGSAWTGRVGPSRGTRRGSHPWRRERTSSSTWMARTRRDKAKTSVNCLRYVGGTPSSDEEMVNFRTPVRLSAQTVFT